MAVRTGSTFIISVYICECMRILATVNIENARITVIILPLQMLAQILAIKHPLFGISLFTDLSQDRHGFQEPDIITVLNIVDSNVRVLKKTVWVKVLQAVTFADSLFFKVTNHVPNLCIRDSTIKSLV